MKQDEVVAALAALAHEHRLKAYRLLVEAGPGGLSAGVVAERLGHSTTRLTTDRYQHALAGMDAEAARKAGDARRAARARMTATTA